MISHKNCRRLLVLFCTFFLTSNAAAATLATLQLVYGGTGTGTELDADDANVSVLLAMGSSYEFILFQGVSFSGADDGQTLSWTANDSNEAGFAAVATLLTNGTDDPLALFMDSLGDNGFEVSVFNESAWLEDALMPGQVDFAGYTITSIVMTATNIDFQPWNGGSTGVGWDSITFDIIGEPTPVPVPGALLLLTSALGLSLRWGRSDR